MLLHIYIVYNNIYLLRFIQAETKRMIYKTGNRLSNIFKHFTVLLFVKDSSAAAVVVFFPVFYIPYMNLQKSIEI